MPPEVARVQEMKGVHDDKFSLRESFDEWRHQFVVVQTELLRRHASTEMWNEDCRTTCAHAMQVQGTIVGEQTPCLSGGKQQDKQGTPRQSKLHSSRVR